MSDQPIQTLKVIAVLATDGNEAVYVDGTLRIAQFTIYIGELIAEVGDRPVLLSQTVLARDFDGEWPQSYEDLSPYMHDTTVSELLANLRESSGNAWDDVTDVRAELNDLRGTESEFEAKTEEVRK